MTHLIKCLPTVITAVVLLFVSKVPLAAHEVWLDAPAFKVELGAEFQANLRNGENFRGASLIYNPRSFTRFEHFDGKSSKAVEGRSGDRPAATLTLSTPGLQALLYESTLSSLTYREWEKFLAFVAHKDFRNTAAEHKARGLPETGFVEAYSRHVKMLFCAQSCEGADKAHGLSTEIVALTNPYTPNLKQLPVQVLFENRPVPDRQVEIFARAPDGEVTVSLARTDAQGIAQIQLEPGTTYLLDSVTLREPSAALFAEREAVWETLWAALTFQTPDAE
ncbi:MAG: DUF4198 domain-containing protein [Pseudomonadota bacterium]